MSARRTAQCACGQASLTVEGEPAMHGVCHCTNCKRRTGSAFGISAYFRAEQVSERAGATTVYAFHHAAQDHDQARHFCSRCGTTLWWTLSSLPGHVGVAGGCFADAALPEPTYSVTHGKKLPWLALPAAWKTRDD